MLGVRGVRGRGMRIGGIRILGKRILFSGLFVVAASYPTPCRWMWISLGLACPCWVITRREIHIKYNFKNIINFRFLSVKVYSQVPWFSNKVIQYHNFEVLGMIYVIFERQCRCDNSTWTESSGNVSWSFEFGKKSLTLFSNLIGRKLTNPLLLLVSITSQLYHFLKKTSYYLVEAKL